MSRAVALWWYYIPRFVSAEGHPLSSDSIPAPLLLPVSALKLAFMSCVVSLPAPPTPPCYVPRKRTMSFSTPTPIKSPRTSLRRTGSYLSLADMQAAEYTPLYGRDGPMKSFTAADSLVIGRYDQRMRTPRRRTTPSRSPSIHSPSSVPQPSSSQIIVLTSRRTIPRVRTSSPLAPVKRTLGERPSLPCTKKREPDLYRAAIKTRMRMSPIGRNILHMGPRVALSIISATEALEHLVSSQHDGEAQCGGDSVLGASWVDVSPEDWEMVDHSL